MWGYYNELFRFAYKSGLEQSALSILMLQFAI